MVGTQIFAGKVGQVRLGNSFEFFFALWMTAIQLLQFVIHIISYVFGLDCLLHDLSGVQFDGHSYFTCAI